MRHARPALRTRALALLAALAALVSLAAAAPAQAGGGLGPRLAGGDPVYSSTGGTCVVVVNLRVGTGYAGLVPGTCTDGFPDWYADPARTVPIGPTLSYHFPTHGHFGYENPDIPVEPTPNCAGAILTSAGDPVVGQPVYRGSPGTGCQSGSVTGVNITVNFGGGLVISDLIRTNLCAEPGDPGGALTAGTTLIGIPVGGSGDCTSGGSSYYLPILPVLSEYGATIV